MGEYVVHRSRFFDFQPKAIHSMSYDDTSKKLAISRSDNTIEIWCMKNEYQESVITPSSDRQVEVVTWCRSQLFSAGLDGFIVMYDMARLIAKKLIPSIGGAIWCMTRNKSETKIAIGTEDGYIVVYEMQLDGLVFEKSFNKQDSRVLSIAWHRDEDMIVSGGIDNIRIWDAVSGQVQQRISLGRIDKKKETLVWCLALTSNFQIISGDSRGKVSIWSAEHGNLIQSFQTHSTDVLCLCLDESEEHIYSSGIDPTIVQLDYLTVSDKDNYNSWVKSNVYYNHTHDVRSILIANNQLISAGVDTKIVLKNIKNKQSKSLIRKYNSMPQKSVVDMCEDFVLFQYEKHLELWRLGQAITSELESSKDGDYLPTIRSPRKFLHLNSKNEEHIVCSSLGAHPTKNANNLSFWVSYSDLNVIHIYRVSISSKQVLEPEVKVDKIKSLPLACGNRPATIMKFFNYNSATTPTTNGHSESSSSSVSGGQLRLCYLTNKSCLQCLKLASDGTEFTLESTIQCCLQQDVTLTDNRVYMMTCKGDYVATVDIDLNLAIWNLKTQTQLCSLPRYDHLATCLSFHPKQNYLLVCYANRMIVEYDFDLNEYTDWSREISTKLPKQWLKQHSKLLNCFYDSSNLDRIITHDEQYLVVINKNEKMPEDFEAKIFQQQLMIKKTTDEVAESSQIQKSALHISNKYRYIVYVGQTMNSHLLIAEVTPLSVSEKLPPSLKQKKFGT